MLSYEEARQIVIAQAAKGRKPHKTATKSVWDALGYVLAQEIITDREYPPFDRSTRDGYAVRAAEAKEGATLRCVGEIKAGDSVSSELAHDRGRRSSPWRCGSDDRIHTPKR